MVAYLVERNISRGQPPLKDGTWRPETKIFHAFNNYLHRLKQSYQIWRSNLLRGATRRAPYLRGTLEVHEFVFFFNYKLFHFIIYHFTG